MPLIPLIEIIGKIIIQIAITKIGRIITKIVIIVHTIETIDKGEIIKAITVKIIVIKIDREITKIVMAKDHLTEIIDH